MGKTGSSVLPYFSSEKTFALSETISKIDPSFRGSRFSGWL